MRANKNLGCLFFAGIIILSLIGLLISFFHSEKPTKKNNLTTWYLTLDKGSIADTLIVVKSNYNISKNFILKKTLEESFSDSLMTYDIEVPDGLVNTITLISMSEKQSINLGGAITGSINNLNMNPDIHDLKYSTKDTVIQKLSAKIATGKFYAKGKNAIFKEIVIGDNDHLYLFNFINEEKSSVWPHITELLKSIKVNQN